ncbi:methionyl-tRNA formyltransferase, partial [Candidatus Peregrinibacteria bacterium CG10_big_fil_rev_8_21_14_0_10_54_7]
MPERFSIVFAGTPEFSVPSLESLIAHPACKVTLVISQPDKPVGRKQVMTPPPVKLCAEKHGIRVTQPKNINR